MLQNLEEAIVVSKGNTIDFTNDIFVQMITRLNIEFESLNEILNLKFLKIFRETEDDESPKSEQS